MKRDEAEQRACCREPADGRDSDRQDPEATRSKGVAQAPSHEAR